MRARPAVIRAPAAGYPAAVPAPEREKERIMGKPNPIDVQKALKGASYPSDRQSLVEQAEKNHADRALVDKVAGLRRDRFDGPNDVEKEIFGS